MVKEKKARVILDQIVLTTQLAGEPFYADNIPEALKQAIKHSKNGGFVAPMWLLARGFPHSDWYTANSEDHSGPGEFRGVKWHYVATLHGGVDGNGILTPDIIDTALKMHRSGKGGLTPVNAANLSKLFKKDVFANLLQGGMPDGGTIPVYSFEQIAAGEHQRHLYNFTRFAIVRTLEQAKQTVSGYESIDRLVDRQGKVTDSQVIAYTAGVTEGQYFIKRARTLKSENLGVWNPFNNNKFDPDTPQSCKLFLGSSGGNNGLYGNGGLNYDARFVWVAPKARAAIQALMKQILDASTKANLEVDNGFVYKGRLYVPVSAGKFQL